MTPVTSRASVPHLRLGDDENDVKASPSACFSNSHYAPTLGGALGHEVRTTTGTAAPRELPDEGGVWTTRQSQDWLCCYGA